MTEKARTWGLMLLLLVVLLCSGAFADYATKGEPREALVASSMLEQGNWILPIDHSGDMAYKPPLFHWLIALFSLPAGYVTEFTSRLPSILALLWLSFITLKWVRRSDARPQSNLRAPLTVLVMVTSFEVFRAGVNCRVDMVLCALIVTAIYSLARGGAPLRRAGVGKWHMLAVLCMSGAVLTKGPVGIILPLGIWWCWSLLFWKGNDRRSAWWLLTLWAILLAVMALVIPGIWYLAAYQQGGERFLRLAWEENFGRMLGTMSYDSHVQPWYYNLEMIAAGLLPWTALLVGSLVCKPWKWMHRPESLSQKKVRRWVLPWQKISTHEMLCWVAVIFILVFYTIPKSKRGVYLLPLYPFAASLAADYCVLLAQKYGKLALRMLWTAMVFLGLYLVAYAIVWPIIVSGKSDRNVAAEVVKITGDTPIYTYINSRMDRFYGVDFYLGNRMRPLLPSGQDMTLPEGAGYTPAMIEMPQDSVFYICVPLHDYEAQGQALGTRFAETGYQLRKIWQSPEKTRDMRQPLVLLKAMSKRTNTLTPNE